MLDRYGLVTSKYKDIFFVKAFKTGGICRNLICR